MRFLNRTDAGQQLADKRAIGVLYLPENERASHDFHARLPEQFDFVLHFDETRGPSRIAKGDTHDRVTDRPFKAPGIAVGVGLVLGVAIAWLGGRLGNAK
jgi:hypothetical protein